ncbi:hypothetical protein OAM78_04030 [Alphaproteobacteria bacterium]|nr:hypothetical protein [Alphaproteobacteria bacterium]
MSVYLKNISANSFLTLSGMSVRFILASLMIRELGPEDYANWIIWLSITTYIAMADCGVISFLQYRLLNASREKSQRVKLPYWRFWASIFLFVHTLIFFVALVFHSFGSAPLFFVILSATAIVQNFARLGQVFARLMGFYHSTVFAQAVANIIFLGFCSLFLDQKTTLTQIASWYCVCFGAVAVWTVLVGRPKTTPDKIFGVYKGMFFLQPKVRERLGRGRIVFLNSVWFLLNFSIPIFLNSIPIFLLGVYFDALSLAGFLLTRMLYNLIFMSSNVVFISVIPEGIAAVGKASASGVKSLILKLLTVNILFAATMGSIITYFLEDLFGFWLGAHDRIELELAFAVFLLSCVLCSINLCLNIAGAIGYARMISLVNFGSIFAMVVIGLFVQLMNVGLEIHSYVLWVVTAPLLIGLLASVALLVTEASPTKVVEKT